MKIADMTVRPAKLADAEFVADLETAIRPDDPRDPTRRQLHPPVLDLVVLGAWRHVQRRGRHQSATPVCHHFERR